MTVDGDPGGFGLLDYLLVVKLFDLKSLPIRIAQNKLAFEPILDFCVTLAIVLFFAFLELKHNTSSPRCIIVTLEP